MLQPTGTDGGTLFVKWAVTLHANDSTNVNAGRLTISAKKARTMHYWNMSECHLYSLSTTSLHLAHI